MALCAVTVVTAVTLNSSGKPNCDRSDKCDTRMMVNGVHKLNRGGKLSVARIMPVNMYGDVFTDNGRIYEK